ncbi:insulinase family protein [Aliiglaciecola litoralis]|uniref:Protease 3 n=1 Tax=Aliiglaciecola litoralis TaxID=582857 RepID=A0ABP3WS93_9ALTE
MLVSQNDHREYALETLPNGLQVLYIHDQNCKKSAASWCVNAGHFNDPTDCCGLAHLLEHLIFNGSENYPEADEFDRFLNQYSGGVNAWTGTEYSNYHFDVAHEQLISALARFKDMLFFPLFEQQAISKEINAIDAEFKLKVNDDLRRLYQVHKETCNPAHPFSQFSVGNAETFTKHSLVQLQSLLRQYHQRFYIPANSRLVVISKHPIEYLKQQLNQIFNDLKSTPLPSVVKQPPLYLPEQLGVQISINPIKDARRLIVSFALPDVQHMYQTKPLEYISHLLGDEGKGSLLVYLKKQDWATNLTAGGGINGSNFKDFNVNLQLTESGKDNISNILNALFYYLQLIKKGLSEPWRLQEKVQLGLLAFNFAESSKTIDEAQQLANQLFHYPNDQVLSGDALITQPNPELIEQCLGYMRPNNMRLKFISKDAPTDKQARWYHTPYKLESVDAEILNTLLTPEPIDELALPDKNPFISKHQEITCVSATHLVPKRIYESDAMHVWFAQDDQFCQPKGDCYVSFDCAAVADADADGASVSAYKRLWAGLVSEHLNDQFYQAGVAGLHYHFYSHQAGFTLHTSGFSQQQLNLCIAIIKQIMSEIDFSNLFQQVKNKQVQSLQNSLLNKPINRLFNRLSGIVQKHTHAPSEVLSYVESATLDDVKAVKTRLFEQYFLEIFVFGNWQKEQVDHYIEGLQELKLECGNGTKIKRDVIDLKHNHRFINAVDNPHKDAAVVLYIQTPSASNRDIAMTILIEQMLASPFFHTLRNEKQLGYLVGSGYLPLNQHPGMAFYIQSPTHSAKELVVEIDAFLHEMATNIEDMREIWQFVKASVAKQLVDSDTSLSVKSQHYWMAIGTEEQDFKHQQALAYELEQLKFNDICAFVQNMIKTELFGSLVLYCAGDKPARVPTQGEEIRELSHFKAQAKYIA